MRIPVQLAADMLSQGVTPEEIVESYPSLDKKRVARQEEGRTRPVLSIGAAGKNNGFTLVLPNSFTPENYPMARPVLLILITCVWLSDGSKVGRLINRLIPDVCRILAKHNAKMIIG